MKRKIIVVLALLAVAAGVVLWLVKRQPRQAGNMPPPISTTTQEKTNGAGSVISSTIHLDERLQGAVAALNTAQDAQARRRQLAALKVAIASSNTNEAVAAIRRFLDSKADSSTGLGFKISGHGALSEAPTLRTALLDQLGQLDPAAAAAYARDILSRSDSPDEWAVAIRNLAWGDTSADGRAYLQQKAGELLGNTAWQQNPSSGYLEAFDAAVFLGGTNLLPALSDLVRKQDNPAVAHAAFLAMDRLVQGDPASLLAALQADPTLMQGREGTRADYFARADVRDPQQRQVLESYLLNPGISSTELAQFAGIFPNANYMISQNLLTPTPTPDHASLAGRDAESLRVVQQWLADPRFAQLRPQLEKMQARISEFVRQEASAASPRSP